MKILITGICGFIGFHVANKILTSNKNIKVIGIDNLNDYYDLDLKKTRLNILNKKKIKILKIDIRNKNQLENLFLKNKFDKVIHFAAQAGVRLSFEKPEIYFDNNIFGFYNLIDCIKKFKIKNFIYSSSSSVYGDSTKFPLKENMRGLNTVSFYGYTKKNNEELAEYYSKNYGLSIIGLRYFTVYGPYGRPDMSPYIFTNNIIKEKSVLLHNNGNHYRDFTNIEDVADIINKLLIKNIEKGHKIFNICSSSPISLVNFINIIENLLNKRARIKKKKKQLGDVIKTYGSNNEINKFVKKNKYIDIETGMKSYIDWFKSFYGPFS